MNTIKFKKNWNRKLDCDYFSTIRRQTPEKVKYYLSKVGKEFDVLLNDNTVCYAKLIQVETDCVLRELHTSFLMVDTGSDEPYSVFKKFGLEPHSKVIILCFRVIKE